MKKKHLLLAALVFTSAMVVAGVSNISGTKWQTNTSEDEIASIESTETPTVNAAAKKSPVASDFVPDKIYFLYNVGADKYYCAGNAWGTQASVGDDPLYVKFTQYGLNDGVYQLKDYFRDEWMLAFFQSEQTMYVDWNNQQDYGWTVRKVGNYYRLQAAGNTINPNYNITSHPNTYVGLDVTENAENTALSPFLSEGEGHYIDWLLVNAASSLDDWTYTDQDQSSSSSKIWILDTPNTAMLRFSWTVSSQASWAELRITLDGEEIVNAHGEKSGTYEILIDGGQHMLTATYSGPQATVKDISFITIDEVIAEKIAHVQEVAAANSHINKVLLEEANNYIAQISAGQYDKAKGIAVINKIEEYATRLAYLHIDISVPVQGAMGDSILAKVENFADVQSLRLTGKLNSDDIYSLKNRLTNLLELDLTGIDWMAIPNDQFRDKTNLTYVILPANVQSIGTDAFYNCQNLKHITFPTTLKSIGEGAFYRTYNIGDVVLPEGFTSMGSYAFEESGLTSVTFPSTLKTINYLCFYNSDNLKTINFNGQTSIGDNAFQYSDAIATLKFPETLTSIGNYAFDNCSRLKNIEFNEGLSNIGTDAFYNCDALQSVILPSTLISMHGAAFHNCDNLWLITCRSIAPPVATNYNVADKSVMTLYVPQLSVNVYKQTLHWDVFDIKGVDIMPDNITIVSDYNLNWPDSLSFDYKPSVTLTSTSNNNQYGSLSVNGNSTLSAGLFSIKYDPNIARNNSYRDAWGTNTHNRFAYTSLVNNANVRADNITLELWLRANSWEFITIPFDVKISDIYEAFEGTPFVIRKYDGEKRAAGLTNETWVNMTADSILHAGQGYIWRSASTDNNRNYTGFYLNALQTVNKNNIFANDNVEVPLNYYESEFAHNRSWNLIGNPYPCFYDIRAMQTSAPITVWDTYQNNYRAYSPQDDAYILNPGQAFFVQRPVDEESIIFLKEGRQTNLTVRDIEYNNSARTAAPMSQRSVFNVILSNGEQADRTRFIINASATAAYEQGRDASKFASLVAVPQLYTIENGVQFAINERPLADAIISLGMQIASEGLYTLTLDTKVENEVWLIDSFIGDEILLSENADGYTFYSEAGSFDNRFTIRLGNGETTGITNVSTLNTHASSTFDLQGRRINEPQKGIYIQNGKKSIVK